MGIFDPKTNTSVAYEQPVQQPQSMGLALANVGTDIAGSILKAKAKEDDESGDDTDAWAMSEFQSSIQKANAARAEGKNSLADRIESTALLNAQRNGLSYDKNLEGAYSALTGRPGEELLFSQEEIMENKIMASPEYESAFVATYSKNRDASPEERHQLAMSQIARQQGQAAILSDQSISWTQGKRDAFFSAVEDFESVALGSLNQMAQENGFADLESIRQSENMWQQMKGGFLSARPEGTTDKQWSQFEARMDQVDETFNTLKEISTDDGISALAAAELAAGIQSREDWTPGMKVIAKQYVKDGLATGAISPSKVRDMVGDVLYENFEPGDGGTTGFDEDGEPESDLIPKSIQDTLKAEDAETSFKRAKNLTKVAGSGESSKITSDPTYQKDFLKTTQIAFSAMMKVGEENRRFLTAEGISEVFNGKIAEGLRAVGKSDPVRARATAEAGVKALDKQFGIASSQLANSLQGTALRLSPDGQLTLNREALLEEISPEVFDRLEKQADDYYDGNLLSLVKDRGKKIPRKEFDPATDDPMGPPTVVPGSIVTKALGDLDMVRSQLRSVKAIQNKRDEFRTLANEFVEEGGEGQDQAEGSQGVDTIGEGANRLISLIDRTEGGADYDTLLSFSNREGGAFAGTSVSNMTLGELSDFSRGEYATFSKKWKRENNHGDPSLPSTPMGRYQIVGDTLRQTMKEMGLPQNMKFTSEVQDAMFHHLASKALKGKTTPESKRAALRGVWEGFKSVGDEELDAAIAEFEGTSPPSYVDLQRPSNMQLAPASQTGRPQTRRNTGGDTGSVSGSEGGSTSSVGGSGVDVPVGAQVPSTGSSEDSSEEATRSAESNKESGGKINEQQRKKVMRILKAQGVDTDAISKFNSVEAAQEAIDKGELKEGDLYEVNGEIEVVEKA